MTIMDNHHNAMEIADKADAAKRRGQYDEAKKFFLEAFYHECSAAMKFKDRPGIEPTRSILFRSAATLAVECGELREAERLISFGLSGSPPDEIIEELRDLLERVNFERHLKLRGIKLEPNELQLSIWGPAIGLGIAQSREFRERIENIETLSFRTLERKLKFRFREKGRPSKEITDKFEVYVSVPRAASFAVTIRLAGDQQYFPELDLGIDVVEEIVEGLDLLNKHEDHLLEERIPDKDYLENFIGLAKQIAPDGKRVSHVGLTLQKNGKEKLLKFERKRTDWNISHTPNKKIAEKERIEIQGTLRFADETLKRRGKIKLVSSQNLAHSIFVPLGMMDDIVRPMFGYEVIVKGEKDQKGDIYLDDIVRVNDE